VPVPPLGTTWYDRGPAYWLRRIGFAVLLLIALLTLLAIVWGFVSGAWEFHPTVGAIVTSVIGVNALVTGWWFWRRSTPRAIEERARTGQTSTSTRGVGAVTGAGGVLGAGALAGNMLAVAVLAVVGSLALGFMVVLVLRCLGPQLPQERALRALLGVPLRAKRR